LWDRKQTRGRKCKNDILVHCAPCSSCMCVNVACLNKDWE
jgi:hypothetical protein